jgi:cell division GTPase FtsZ
MTPGDVGVKAVKIKIFGVGAGGDNSINHINRVMAMSAFAVILSKT